MFHQPFPRGQRAVTTPKESPMAVTHYDLTATFTDLLGTAYSPTSAKVVAWIETNVASSEGIVDEVANSIALGGSRQVADSSGNVTWANLVGSDSTPADINLESGTLQYRVTAEYVDAITRRRKTWVSGWFSLTADIDLADVISETYVPAAWMTTATATLQTYVDAGQAAATTASAAATTASGAADTAVNAAGLASEIALGDADAAFGVAQLNPTSPLSVAQGDVLDDPTHPLTAGLATMYAPVAKDLRHPLTGMFHAEGFGAVGDGVADDTAALQAAIDAAETGATMGTVLLGAVHKVTSTLRISKGASIIGRGHGGPATSTNANPTGSKIVWAGSDTDWSPVILVQNSTPGKWIIGNRLEQFAIYGESKAFRGVEIRSGGHNFIDLWVQHVRDRGLYLNNGNGIVSLGAFIKFYRYWVGVNAACFDSIGLSILNAGVADDGGNTFTYADRIDCRTERGVGLEIGQVDSCYFGQVNAGGDGLYDTAGYRNGGAYWRGHSVAKNAKADGTTQNQKFTITLAGATGGTFTLTQDYQTTGPIAYNALASTVHSALTTLSNWTTGNITVTGPAGGPYVVEYVGAWANAFICMFSANGTALTGTTPTVTVARTQEGGPHVLQPNAARKSVVSLYTGRGSLRIEGDGTDEGSVRGLKIVQAVSEGLDIRIDGTGVMDYQVHDFSHGDFFSTQHYYMNDEAPVPLGAGRQQVGTVTRASVGANSLEGFQFPETAEARWGVTVPPPYTWNNGKIVGVRLYYATQGADNTGNHAIQIGMSAVGNLEGVTTGSTTETFTVPAASVAVLRRATLMFATPLSYSREELVNLLVSRLPADAIDTNAGTFTLLTASLIYVSRGPDSDGGRTYDAPSVRSVG